MDRRRGLGSAPLEVGDRYDLKLLCWIAPAPVSLIACFFMEAVEDPMKFLERKCSAIIVTYNRSACEFPPVFSNLSQVAFGYTEQHRRFYRRKLLETLPILRSIFEGNDFLLSDLADIGPVAKAFL